MYIQYDYRNAVKRNSESGLASESRGTGIRNIETL